MIPRYRTAIYRNALSRPLRCAIDDGILSPGLSLFDYGCGRGSDVEHLAEAGFSCTGWDPQYAPGTSLQPAAVVNLGYVVNVIENPNERTSVLKHAWSFAQKLLIVAGRLTFENHANAMIPYLDGRLTSRGTFQKFFEQNELRLWIDSTLEESSVAAAPGIFYVFRDSDLKYQYLSSRLRRAAALPKQRRSDQIFDTHRTLFEELMAFISARGRLPVEDELRAAAELSKEVGSVRRAFMVIRRATDRSRWEEIRAERAQDLLVYMALARFSRRPKFSVLPYSLQLDIRSFFSNYSHACELADKLLFSAGNRQLIENACRSSKIGKLTPTGLYVHRSALESLDPLLRVYEGCARALTGTVEGANVIKLYIREPRLSYLCYPAFETEAHPSLYTSTTVHLQTFELRRRDYSMSDNPPILHRKEAFLRSDDPLRIKYERLTRQEEAKGLYQQSAEIGTLQAWQQLLKQNRLQVRGHRLQKTHGTIPEPNPSSEQQQDNDFI